MASHLDPFTYLLGDVAITLQSHQAKRKLVLNPYLPVGNGDRSATTNNRASRVPSETVSSQIISCHISLVPPFLDQLAFQTVKQKNWSHPDAFESNEPFSPKMLVLAKSKNGKTYRGATKIWVVVLVCKGSSVCIPSSCHGITSPRRHCGFGLRLFARKENPEIVHIEQFGSHLLPASIDDGWRFIPPLKERVVLTPSMVMDAMSSFSKGVKPAKQLQVIAEGNALMKQPQCKNDLLKQLQLCHRRYNYAIRSDSEEEGVLNITNHFMQSDDFIFERVDLKDGIWLLYLSHIALIRKASAHGGDVIGVDATHNVTCHKNVYLFAIMGRCPGGAFPLGYFITNAKDETAISQGLQSFRDTTCCYLQEEGLSDEFQPKAICIDMDMASNNAIRRVFPSSVVILCHFHFMTNMYTQARSLKHGLSPERIVDIMQLIRRLSAAICVFDFISSLKELKISCPTLFEYLDEYYLNDAWIDTFCEVNRHHLPLSVQRLCRSNMLTEVSFRTLKYIVLDGFMNMRLDTLLYSIAYRLFPYFISRTNLLIETSPRFLIKLDAQEKGTYLFRYHDNFK